MIETEYDLSYIPGRLLDVDLDADDVPVFVSEETRTQWLLFGGSAWRLPLACMFPLVRAISHDSVLVLGRRTSGARENAWVFSRSGELRREFFVGDCIEDALVIGESIVITYFDQAFGNRYSGVCVFDLDGGFHYKFDERFGGAILDCLCATQASRGAVAFLSYPEPEFVLLDLKRDQARSKRSRFITLFHAATKSRTNFSFESSCA